MSPYADLEIRILERQDAGYPVEITLEGGQEFPRGFLAADILPWTSSGDPRADGERLFAALFADAAARSAWDRTRGQHLQRRVRLRLDATAPELHALPWELLHDGETWLSADAATPFSRYLPSDAPWGGSVPARPLRVLAVIANPTDLSKYKLAPLNVPVERQRLEAVFSDVPADRLRLEFLDAPVTLEHLEKALADDYHVLHFVGHGRFSQRRAQAALYLQDDAGNTHMVSDVALREILRRQAHRPSLVFLAACQSASRVAVDAFAGLAPQLVQVGVPAVVAMQDKVAISAAGKLTTAFYEALLRCGEVDRALNTARSLLLTGQSLDAGVPVLLMRLKDGRLWKPLKETPSSMMPRETDYLIEALRLKLALAPEVGLQAWAETFDALFADWQLESAWRLLRLLKQDHGILTGSVASVVLACSSEGNLLAKMGRWAEAERIYQKALTAARILELPENEAWLLSNLGNIRMLAGQHKAAHEAYQEALAFYTTLDYTPGQAICLNNLANLEADRGEIEQAIIHRQAALILYRELADLEGEALALNNLANLRQLQEDWSTAKQLYQNALKLYKELKNLHGQAQVLGNLGILALNLDQLDTARQCFELDLKITTALGDRRNQAQTLNNLAITHRRLEQSAKALAYYERSLLLKRELGDRHGELITLVNLCHLLKATGDQIKLYRYLTEANKLAQALGDANALEQIRAIRLQEMIKEE